MNVFEAEALLFATHLGPGLVLLDTRYEFGDQLFTAGELGWVFGNPHQQRDDEIGQVALCIFSDGRFCEL